MSVFENPRYNFCCYFFAMDIKVKNASQQPLVLYGRHFRVGLAEYANPGSEPIRVLINEAAAKKMDATFPGCPIYVLHVDKVDLHNIQSQADGYVTESFYNKTDGAHWAKFVLISDAAHKAYQDGWQLSNAYLPVLEERDGQWQGVSYNKEVVDGKYEHLALVPNPRYNESIILTVQEFKKYNADKEVELTRLANSKEKPVTFSFFKKQKMENTAETNLNELIVLLPKCKKEFSVSAALEGFDSFQNMNGYAANEHMVKAGEEEMSVEELSKKYLELKAMIDAQKENAEGDSDGDGDPKDDDKVKNDADAPLSHDQKHGSPKAPDSEKADSDSKKPEADAEEFEPKKSAAKHSPKRSPEEVAEGKAHFEKLKNAAALAAVESPTIHINADRLALGKARYGSN